MCGCGAKYNRSASLQRQARVRVARRRTPTIATPSEPQYSPIKTNRPAGYVIPARGGAGGKSTEESSQNDG